MSAKGDSEAINAVSDPTPLNRCKATGPWPHEVVGEASRCLQCHNAPCTAACPAGVDVAGFIRKLRAKDFEGAAEVIDSANPFGEICGKICPAEELCEGRCTLASSLAGPIRIRELQSFASRHFGDSSRDQAPAKSTDKRVAVIGGGPAGLSCARALRKYGHGVVIYEKKSHLGGTPYWAIPSHRLESQMLDSEVERVLGLGVEVTYGCNVGRTISLRSLMDRYDAIFVAAGLGPAERLSLPGADREGIVAFDEFLQSAKTGELDATAVKGVVAVVGGGNTAIDCACVARQSGAERAIVIYRRGPREMPAWKGEMWDAMQSGVEFLWLTSVTAISESPDGGMLLTLARTRLADPDDSGRRKPVLVQGSEYTMRVDLVVQAIGQAPNRSLIAQLPVELTDGCRVTIDPTTGSTSHRGIFAGGDAVNGGATVVQAVLDGMRAAEGIHRYLVQSE